MEQIVVNGLYLGASYAVIALGLTLIFALMNVLNFAHGQMYVMGGFITYTNAAKQELLGVPGALLDRHGAVSEAVARAMAAGVRQRFGAALGVGITGLAGPGGGTEEKPVGLVYVGIASADRVEAREYRFLGSRADIRQRAAIVALDDIRRTLLESAGTS